MDGSATGLAADFDNSGVVDFEDFLQFAGVFGSAQGDPQFDSTFDLVENGVIDFDDFLAFAGEFGSSG